MKSLMNLMKKILVSSIQEASKNSNKTPLHNQITR